MMRGKGAALALLAILLFHGCTSLKHGSDRGGAGENGGGASGGGRGGVSGGGTGGESGGGSGGDDGGHGPTPDNGPFRVLSSEPEDGATLMDPEASIRVECSEPIDPSSVTDATFSVTQDGTRVTGELLVNGSAIQFKPSERLVLSNKYIVRASARIFSKTVEQLKEEVFEFTVREGHWTYKPIATRENQDQLLEAPRIAASPSGRVAVAWHVAHRSFRLGYTRASRRNLDGSWSDLGLAGNTPNGNDPAPGKNAGVAIFDSGTTVIGHQPDPTNGVGQAELTCVDANGIHTALPLNAKARTTFVIQMFPTYGESLSVLERTDSASNDEYFVVDTGCSVNPGAIGEWELQGQTPNGSIFEPAVAEGAAAWTVRDDSDAGLRTSVWIGRRGESKALSQSSTAADSPALATDLLLWRQDEASDASTIWASVHDYVDWSQGERLSAASSKARAPAVATASRTINMRTSEGGLGVWLQEEESKMRVFGTFLNDIHTPKSSWLAPTPVSDAFLNLPLPSHPSEEIPVARAVVALSSSGNGMAVWSQPTDDAVGYDIYAVPFLASQAWQVSKRQIISTGTHEASAIVSLAMDSRGRAFATWTEADSLMVGQYD